MKRQADRAGFAPVIRSTYRDRGTQTNLWNRCQRREASFPVKEPGCSQHEFGYAFDMVATGGAFVADAPVPGRVSQILCGVFGICGDQVERSDQPAAQFALQLMARKIGLSTSASDKIHFSIFPSSVWDPHMRSTFGLGCRTCVPDRIPLSGADLGFDEFVVPGLGRKKPRSFSGF